jgi:nucleotide-binding universal stress UspA family protein
VTISILAPINNSISSRWVVDFLCQMPLRPDEVEVKFVHILREPKAGEDFLGEQFIQNLPERFIEVLNQARQKMVDQGFNPVQITAELITRDYPTITDGIIDTFRKGSYNMVVVGRKRMSKAEEFVLGDPSVKLVRELSGTAIVVVKGR